MLFNRMFRRDSMPAYAIRESGLKKEIMKEGVELCEILKLSWYERSSVVVIMKKKDEIYSEIRISK